MYSLYYWWLPLSLSLSMFLSVFLFLSLSLPFVEANLPFHLPDVFLSQKTIVLHWVCLHHLLRSGFLSLVEEVYSFIACETFNSASIPCAFVLNSHFSFMHQLFGEFQGLCTKINIAFRSTLRERWKYPCISKCVFEVWSRCTAVFSSWVRMLWHVDDDKLFLFPVLFYPNIFWHNFLNLR